MMIRLPDRLFGRLDLSPPKPTKSMMPLGIRFVVPAVLLAVAQMMIPPVALSADAEKSETGTAGSQFYEVRNYVLGEKGDAAAVDQYLRDALIPALDRQGIGPVGAFEPTESDETSANSIFVVIPYDTLGDIAKSQDRLASDTDYQSAAAKYLDRPHTNPPFARIRSEILSSLACWPTAKVADGSLENSDRVYELRLYESANEKIAETKIDMFNSGEVPIFLDCGIQPVFIGKCVAGPQMPSMTYLTTYPDEASRLKAWKAFLAHPDWATLKVVPKYVGTVSRIDKFVLRAKPYSQM